MINDQNSEFSFFLHLLFIQEYGVCLVIKNAQHNYQKSFDMMEKMVMVKSWAYDKWIAHLVLWFDPPPSRSFLINPNSAIGKCITKPPLLSEKYEWSITSCQKRLRLYGYRVLPNMGYFHQTLYNVHVVLKTPVTLLQLPAQLWDGSLPLSQLFQWQSHHCWTPDCIYGAGN